MPLRDKLRALSPKPLAAPPGLGNSPAHPVDLEQLDSVWPPPSPTTANETPADRERRLEAEREAKRRNDDIDAEIERDRQERKKRRIDVKIILLGTHSSQRPRALRKEVLIFLATFRSGGVWQVDNAAQLPPQVCARGLSGGGSGVAGCY